MHSLSATLFYKKVILIMLSLILININDISIKGKLALLFNSYEYIFLFLPAVFAGYFFLHRQHRNLAARLFLVAASLFFYAYWKTEYLALLLFSILFNYSIGSVMKNSTPHHRARRWLILGIAVNLGLLGYFKYTGFLFENLNTLFGLSLPCPHIVLPLAISFFTFQQIAYLVDTYRGEAKAHGFLDYVLFVTFFPQLIAGPIVHHKEMMLQFAKRSNWALDYGNIATGLFLFSLGLFKKVVIADSFALWVDNGFAHAASLNMMEAWFTSLSYTMQLYFDFSGYTDMALGAALLFNIKLPINFDSPYKAVNIREFWRRWHMTLTRFLRDYLYIPLGGSRRGPMVTYRNILLVFVLGGIWHGAGWTFAVWGLLHGVALSLHRLWSSLSWKMPRWSAWALTFFFVNTAWVFFRADSLHDAWQLLSAMFFGDPVLPGVLERFLGGLERYGVGFESYMAQVGTGNRGFFYLFVAFVTALAAKNSVQLALESPMGRIKMLYAAGLFVASVLSMQKISEFIYFNF